MTVLAGLMIVVGLLGIVLPVLPGLLLCWAGVLVWAIAEQTSWAWTVLGVATLVFAIGSVVKYLLPGRRMRDAGVPLATLVIGTVLGIVGFFVVPVLGMIVGFVAGIYLAERVRLGDNSAAWPSTVASLKAVGFSMAIELLTGLLILVAWGVGVWRA